MSTTCTRPLRYRQSLAQNCILRLQRVSIGVPLNRIPTFWRKHIGAFTTWLNTKTPLSLITSLDNIFIGVESTLFTAKNQQV